MVIGTIHEYRGTQLKEDLSPILAQFGYEGRPATMIIDDGESANSDRIEWHDRDLAARDLNSNAQGFTYTAANVSAADRRVNHTQILAKVIRVSETTEASDLVGGSALRDQTKLRMVEYLNDLEYTTLNQTLESGDSGTTAGKWRGIFEWALSHGVTEAGAESWETENSGISADTDNLATMQLKAMKKGTKLTDFLVDDTIKRRVSTTSSDPAPVYRVQSDRDIIENIDGFRTDFGGSRLHVSFDVEHESGGTTGLFGAGTNGHLLLGLDRTMIDRAWLRRTRMVRVPALEDAITSTIKGEHTYRFWTPPSVQVDWNVY